MTRADGILGTHKHQRLEGTAVGRDPGIPVGLLFNPRAGEPSTLGLFDLADEDLSEAALVETDAPGRG